MRPAPDSGTPGGPGQGPLYLDRNLRVIYGVTLMAVLAVSSITPAFPSVIRAFGIRPASVGLLITVFTLPGVVFAPLFGVLADRWGRKKILVPSLFLFALAGGACAFAPDLGTLLVLRFFQGLGAASLNILYGTIIGDLFSGPRRGAAMGYNASVLSVGTAAFPAIGGALTMFGWRYPFLLPLLAIPVGLTVAFVLESPDPESRQTLRDYLAGVKDSLTREVLVIFMASIATFLVLYGPFLTYYPLLIGSRFKGSALIIGLMLSSMSVVTALTSSQLGRLTRTLDIRTLIKLGFVAYAVSMAMVPFVGSLPVLLIPTILYGLGHGVIIPGVLTLLADLAPMEHRAAFMSLNGMVLRFGQTLGPIMAGGFFTLWGMNGAFASGAVVSALAVLLLGIMLKK